MLIADEVNDSPIEQVRLTVPITDDPTIPCLTFRTWALGLSSCVLLSFVNQFFVYRTNPIGISSVCAQIVTLPLGKLMAATLPKKVFHVPMTNWSFSLNPGPFTLKEHVLITIFANAGAAGPYAVNIITIVKAFYGRGINAMAAMLLAQTTQVSSFFVSASNAGHQWQCAYKFDRKIFSCSVMAGLVCSGSTLLILLTCGGREFLFKCHSSGKQHQHLSSIDIRNKAQLAKNLVSLMKHDGENAEHCMKMRSGQREVYQGCSFS